MYLRSRLRDFSWILRAQPALYNLPNQLLGYFPHAHIFGSWPRRAYTWRTRHRVLLFLHGEIACQSDHVRMPVAAQRDCDNASHHPPLDVYKSLEGRAVISVLAAKSLVTSELSRDNEVIFAHCLFCSCRESGVQRGHCPVLV